METANEQVRVQDMLSTASQREALQLPPSPSARSPLERPQVLEPLHRVGTAASSVPTSYLGRLWRRHVTLTVPHQGCRDHWANERTVLSWFRSAQAFAVLGVVIAQLMRLTTNGDPSPTFGYFIISVPLAACCQLIAIILVLIGVTRFFQWQHEIAVGYSVSGGWQLSLTFLLAISLLLTLFVLVISVAIERAR